MRRVGQVRFFAVLAVRGVPVLGHFSFLSSLGRPPHFDSWHDLVAVHTVVGDGQFTRGRKVFQVGKGTGVHGFGVDVGAVGTRLGVVFGRSASRWLCNEGMGLS